MMKSSPASVLSQLSKLVLGSACFVLAIGAGNVGVNSIKKALFADALSVSPALLSWTGDLHPQFKSSTTNISLHSPLDAVAADAFSEDISSQVHQGLQRIAQLEQVEHRAARRARIVHQRNVVLAKAILPAVQPNGAHSDLMTTSQSSPQLAKAVVVASAPVQPLTESEKLQSVQAALVSRFFVAMNDVPQAATQFVQNYESLDTQTKIDSVLKLIAPQAPKPTHARAVLAKKKESEVIAEADVSEETEAQVSAPIIVKDVSGESLSPVQKLASNDSAFKLGGLSSQDQNLMGIQPVKVARAVYPPSTPLVLQDTATPPQATAPPTDNEDNTAGATLVHPTNQFLASNPRSQSTVASMAQSARQMWGSGYSAQHPVGYSTQNTQTAAIVNSQNAFIPNTHKLPSTTKSAGVVDKIGSSSSAAMIMSGVATPPLRPSFGPLLDRTSRWAFHEAFDWNTSVGDPKVEVLSQEGAIPDQVQARGQSTGQTLGWRIAKANQHWATLFWSTPNQEEVPMLNALSAKMLSVKAAAALQNDAGIILAKVPAGWTLEFSGRSERPLVFDRTNHILAPSATEGSNGGERYYVFLNAAPGEQILYLNHTGGETGALAIPVLGGVMAYADLTQVEKRTISGRILEAADNSPRGVPGIHVQVVGSGSSTVTGSTGDFKIDNVIAFGDQSLYLEAETQKSFPHRYKLSPGATTHLSLFHLNETQVHEWIGQLEGGVSSESGLILGALPTLAASQEDRKPVVGTRSLANSPTLTPETYTLSGSGQLMVKTPLNGIRSRFISVQVPEGPTLVEVVDKDNRLIWSEITVISPRVLTIVGPY